MRTGRRVSRLSCPIAVVVVTVAVLAGGGPVQVEAAERADESARVDALLSRYHELGLFNGSALVARDGEVVMAGGYGAASFEWSVPNGAATRHWIGSVTKVFTATIVMRLADQGKLALDSRVADVLPWYRADTASRVTVRQLLSHTSGIPDYMHLPGVGRDGFRQQAGDAPIAVRAFAEKWCSADLQWEPGSKWGYSNSGYVILGAIIEQVTGRPFEDALRSLVLEPAGMRDSGDLAARPRAIVTGLTAGYEKVAGGVVTRRPWNVSTAFGAGAMYSTVEDLLRFDRALYRDDFVSPAARAALFTPGPGGYGCGFEVRRLPIGPDRAERTVAGHEGYIFWSLSRIYRIEQERIFVALINNTGDAPLPAVFAGIADILYGREPAWPRPSAAEAVHSLASTQGGAAAVARYRELCRRGGRGVRVRRTRPQRPRLRAPAGGQGRGGGRGPPVDDRALPRVRERPRQPGRGARRAGPARRGDQGLRPLAAARSDQRQRRAGAGAARGDSPAASRLPLSRVQGRGAGRPALFCCAR